MKSINEAVEQFINNLPVSNTCEYNADENRQRKAFKSGAEFAQRWIPVEEELPPVNESNDFDKKHSWSSDVIAKSNNTFYIANYNSNGKAWSVKGTSVFGIITHWRPIEYK